MSDQYQEELKTLCEQHPDVTILIRDSVEAGNCLDGSKQFRRQYFPGRRSVRASELLPYLDHYGVQRVVEHKLRPLLQTQNTET